VHIRGVSWAGVKTDRYEAMTAFFRNVAGMEVIADRDDFTVFRLPDGDQVEIFGPRGPDPREQFARNEVVAGLLVDDIVAATEELRRAGVELVGEAGSGANGYAWQHFRAPDGKVFELCCDPSR
jgi:catechol 2,3-dioxygenase-like lactoylglutathione lyase family enzyme